MAGRKEGSGFVPFSFLLNAQTDQVCSGVSRLKLPEVRSGQRPAASTMPGPRKDPGSVCPHSTWVHTRLGTAMRC